MEEILPPATESGAGFEPPRVRQLTVFMENRVGRLLNLVRSFEEGGGRIVSLDIHNAGDTALVRLICSDPDQAREVFEAERFSLSEQDVLVVELPRRSAEPLSSICAALLAAEINIFYAYPLMLSPKGPALALYVDDHTLAAQLLIKKGFTIIGESDLRNPDPRM